MISQLHKKHPITQLNTRPATSPNAIGPLVRLAFFGGTLLMLSVEASAATDASNSKLKWGRPPIASRTTSSPKRIRPIQKYRSTSITRDTHVVAAAWEGNPTHGIQQTVAKDRSVVVQRSAPVYDPFDEHDRLAQLPDDPFDEPVDESVPESDDDPVEDPVEDIDAAEDAVEREIKRRRSTGDLFDEEQQDPLEFDPLAGDPLEGIDESDPGSDEEEEEMLQPGLGEFKIPDLGLDYDQREEEELTVEELEQRQEELEIERRESQESCREELEKIEADRISSIDLSIRVEGNAGVDFPYECAVSNKRHQPRQWPQITYTWKAAALCHKPLYFEQVQLERYGHSWGPISQPIMSGVHFFGTLPILPYKMGIRTPTECVYTLGYYRPGSCAPYMIDPVPFTWRAALFQGGSVTALPFIIP